MNLYHDAYAAKVASQDAVNEAAANHVVPSVAATSPPPSGLPGSAPGWTFCPACGTRFVEDARFCTSCGQERK